MFVYIFPKTVTIICIHNNILRYMLVCAYRSSYANMHTDNKSSGETEAVYTSNEKKSIMFINL